MMLGFFLLSIVLPALAATTALAWLSLRRGEGNASSYGLTLRVLGYNLVEPVLTQLALLVVMVASRGELAAAPFAVLVMAVPTALLLPAVFGNMLDAANYRAIRKRVLWLGLARWLVTLSFVHRISGTDANRGRGSAMIGALLLYATAVWGWRQLAGPLARPQELDSAVVRVPISNYIAALVVIMLAVATLEALWYERLW